ncbi:MAG TPA: hypothetical protein PLR06_08000 [Cyclobacteriaceae bacterium]|nr:hypothetical protein [Cyclobacteriaceae bacterium]
MSPSLLFFIPFLMVTIVSAQKVEVFERAQRPEFQNRGKNTQIAHGYGFIKLNSGDTVKGALKIEKEGDLIISFNIKSRKQRFNYTPGDVKAYGFYPYRVFIYDPLIPGNPNFYPGYVITNSGVSITGQVAVLNVMGTEWRFFPKKIYFIPDKTDFASSMGGGDLLEVGQKLKKDFLIFDAFGDGYLQRIVSGTLRLSYNPDPKVITQPLFYDASIVQDSAKMKALQHFIEEGINEGKPLGEVIRGKDSPVSADMSLANAELIEKTYFLKDTRSGKIYMLNEANFRSVVEPLYSQCPNTANASTKGKTDLYNYRKVEESVLWFNANCK